MSAKALSLGPVMLDLEGAALGADDRRRLLHPLTGGVILFSRNFVDPAQLDRLTAEIRTLRNPPLLIAVDHEGGRVQRFRDGFTVLPAMAELGRSWDENPRQALRLAQDLGFVLAAELRAHGVDLALAPVLDVDHGMSEVIGDRAFHSDPRAIADLARALLQGFKQAGMSGVGKHFPGHGHVLADSHHASPVDERSYEEIEAVDLVPFRRLIEAGLGGIMPAHVIFPKVDERPAGYSVVWLKTILRERLGFGGVIFSDDLSMEGAGVAGGVIERAMAALGAGCDIVLICNNPKGTDELLEGLRHPMPAVSLARLARLHGRQRPQAMDALRGDTRYTRALDSVAAISRRDGELPLA
jgi:beta-N-acetylhexosaminidase